MKKTILMVSFALALIPALVAHFDGQTSNPGAWTFNHNSHGYFVTADQSFSADTSLHTINGLQIPMPNTNSPHFLAVQCHLWVSQATAGAANIYGIQFTTNGPTNSVFSERVETSLAATGVFAETVPATITGTSATTVTTATPAAISTIYHGELNGFVEWPANTAGTLNIMAGTGNTSDALTVKRDSFCFFPGQ